MRQVPARFLFSVWPVPGHVYPPIAIAQALRGRGHECAFYTGSRGAQVLRDEGFPTFLFQSLDEDRLYETLFSRPADPNSLRFMAMLRKWLLGTVPQQVDDLERVITAWRPDVLVTDPTVWGPILVLHEKLGIPVAVCGLCPACMIPGPDAPPFGMGLPRPRNWHTRLLSLAAYKMLDLVAARFRHETNLLRRSYGLPSISVSALAFGATMPLYLVPGVREFDYERTDLPPSIHYVGPYLWNKPRHVPPPAWLGELRNDRPWVHATEGTVHVGDPFVLRAAARALGTLPVEAVLTTGGRDPADVDLGPLAANVHLARWISHSDLLPRTSVMITTGGAGSVLAALNAHVPLILVPTEWDKPEVAQRVVEAGAGLRISPRRCTPKRLRAAVERILGDGSFRQNAERLARIFARHDGAATGAQLLEELATRSKGRAAAPGEAVATRGDTAQA